MLSSGDILKIVISFIMPDNVVAQLVTHYLVGTGDDIDESDTLDEIESELETAWAFIEGSVVDGVTGDTMKLSLWDAVLKQFDEVASKAITGFDGTSLDEMLPHGVAPVIRFFTNVGRRQGRKFLPGFAEGTQVDGDLTAAVIATLVNFAVNWNDQVTVDSTLVNQGVFNQTTENFRGFQQTTAVNTVLGYQRRRKAGVGI